MARGQHVYKVKAKVTIKLQGQLVEAKEFYFDAKGEVNIVLVPNAIIYTEILHCSNSHNYCTIDL